jgi:hypothetical protein
LNKNWSRVSFFKGRVSTKKYAKKENSRIAIHDEINKNGMQDDVILGKI